jgi:hypothetical protein
MVSELAGTVDPRALLASVRPAWEELSEKDLEATKSFLGTDAGKQAVRMSLKAMSSLHEVLMTTLQSKYRTVTGLEWYGNPDKPH